MPTLARLGHVVQPADSVQNRANYHINDAHFQCMQLQRHGPGLQRARLGHVVQPADSVQNRANYHINDAHFQCMQLQRHGPGLQRAECT
eukprot:s6156_g3.t1